MKMGELGDIESLSLDHCDATDRTTKDGMKCLLWFSVET